ncbi:rod shape-determining protein MreD [Paenibacillus albiflavus]|uniref:Rod shape-determining protein MreD n=1 Tax=Paenibacillus albiflavus TaxID=2545760 RepID=A0A4R4E886_9BACL|nr:rod shape-determining protein MreD [Paenibacillus albiflavus]TCZ75163.1 rod shape-determining protein MreD [Paenibacillus albiflavus]
MKRHSIWLLCLLMFFLQSTWFNWILPVSWQSDVHVSPNIVFVLIMYVALYMGRHKALMYGLIFGILQDFMFYGHMLGVHSFAMGLTAYLLGLLQARKPYFILNITLLIGLSYIFFESIMYGTYLLFKVTHMDYLRAFTHNILPSALFSMLVALAIYLPVRKLLDNLISLKKVQEDSSR